MADSLERKAKDLVRARELPERRAVGEATAAALFRRLARRPAGCSARFFTRVGADDPFAEAPRRRRVEQEEDGPRPVAAAARFARLDGEATRRARTVETMGSSTAKASDDLLARLRAEAAKRREQGLDLTHTPSAFGTPARNPIARGAPLRPKPRKAPAAAKPAPARRPPPPDPDAPEAERRRPPLLRDYTPDTAPPGSFGGPRRGAVGPRRPAGAERPSGRIRRDAPPPGGAPPLIRPEGTASGGPSRPKIGAPPGGAPPLLKPDAPGKADAPRRRRPAPGTPPGGAPPLVREPGARGEAPPSKNEAPPPPAPAAPKAPPPPAARPAPKAPPSGDPMADFFAPSPPTPPAPAAPSGGLDDLFGGMQEGRVRLGRVKRPSADDGGRDGD